MKTYISGILLRKPMAYELYIGRVPAGTSSYYAGRVYERAETGSRTVKYTINGASWTALLMDARKVSQAQQLEVLADEPHIPEVFPLKANGFAPLPKRDFDFLVKKALKLAQKKVAVLKRDDTLRQQHADDGWMHKQNTVPQA